MENGKPAVQDLGTANGWRETPSIVENCTHQLKERNLGRCYNEYRCDICGYTYRVDSSD